MFNSVAFVGRYLTARIWYMNHMLPDMISVFLSTNAYFGMCCCLVNYHFLPFLDEVKMVSIIPPSQVYNSTAPAGISLIFTASVSSVHGTNFLDISDYQWHFGDNTTKKTDSPIVEHTYTTAGHYTVMLSVHSSFIESSGDSNLPLTVYEGGLVAIFEKIHAILLCVHMHS